MSGAPLMRGTATCGECERVFDLADEVDVDEWFYGHDCEDVALTCHTCGRVGNRDDGIEPGGPCQEPCPGTVEKV
jgi:hypothetical protein